MINIAICDDCKEDALKLKGTVNKYIKDDITVDLFFDGKELLDSGTRFDIVFLDIDLKDVSGIDIGNKIKENCYHTLVIYVTNFTNFYSEAFSVHAYQYVLKPFDEKIILSVLDEAIGCITNIRSQKSVILDIDNNVVNLELQNILYFEFEDRKIKIVSKNGINYIRVSLKYIYNIVKDYDFGMPHKAFIVNYFYVKSIKNNNILLENSELIPIAQKRAAMFRKDFFDFLNKVYYVI